MQNGSFKNKLFVLQEFENWMSGGEVLGGRY
jgi:hypothetical protein